LCIFELLVHQYEIYIIIFVIISVVVVQNGGFCKKKEVIIFYYHTLVCNKMHFQFFTWKFFDNYLTKITYLLEGITFILDALGFELHKKVTSPSRLLTRFGGIKVLVSNSCSIIFNNFCPSWQANIAQSFLFPSSNIR
jgi:hypothetical protein